MYVAVAFIAYPEVIFVSVSISYTRNCISSFHFPAGLKLSLLELFLHGQGGVQTRVLLASGSFLDEDPFATWDQVLLPTCVTIAQLVYPYWPYWGRDKMANTLPTF